MCECRNVCRYLYLRLVVHANGAAMHSIAAASATLVYFLLTCLHLYIATQYCAGLIAGSTTVGRLVHIRAIILRQKRWEVQCAIARYFSAIQK